MSTYFDAVKPYTKRVQGFNDTLVNELDTKNGAFSWWNGYTDDKRLILIGDYLVQSVIGITDSLGDAALAATEHKEKVHADDFWMNTTSQGVSIANPNASNEDFLRALKRGDVEEKRDRTIHSSAAHTFIHLCQALDRAAAAMAVVAGLDTEVLRVGWPHIERWAEQDRVDRPPFQAPTQQGIDVQKGVLDLSKRWVDFGPKDWLPWLVASRNSAAHRAPMTQWNILKLKKGRGDGLLRPFFRQPARSEMHSMSRPERNAADPLASLVIIRDSPDVLLGLVDSMGRYMAFIVEELKKVWERRKSDPRLIVQPGRQWKLEKLTDLKFDGYGIRPTIMKSGPVHVGPGLSRRLQAAKVMDDDRNFWD